MKRPSALALALLSAGSIAVAQSAGAADAGAPGHAGVARPTAKAPAAKHAAAKHAAAKHAKHPHKDAAAPHDAGAPGDAAAEAEAGDAGAQAASPDGGVADQGTVTGSCIEHLPPGKQHPKLSEKFQSRGVAGHVATLEVTVEHGKGETVLPNGFHLQLGSDAEHALERAGFALPDPDGGAGPTLKTKVSGQHATTTVKIPLVPLPTKPGRQKLSLPPLPIAIARASGEVITLCTRPHEITVEDPTGNTPHAKPHPNPKPRRQMEEWTTARNVTYAALIALVVGALVAWLLGRWLRRPRPEPPPPPPRPPWETALEELFDIRHAGLITEQRFSEHFDRVSHTVRKYLGDRYGFDGLESTTREILTFIGRVMPAVSVMPEIEVFLREADLVKFARLTPTEQDCETALARGEHIVHSTIPPLTTGPGRGAGAPAQSSTSDAGAEAEPAAFPDESAEPRSPYAPPETQDAGKPDEQHSDKPNEPDEPNELDKPDKRDEANEPDKPDEPDKPQGDEGGEA